MRKFVIAALFALAAAPAAAAEAPATVTVPFADLNLSSAAGSATLEARISAAVNSVCKRPNIRDLKAMQSWEDCKAEARTAVQGQLAYTGAPVQVASAL
ncbi:UrcA family protein [Altererythrobacter xixiisoli]|uniref:UrcA family protein n=1 Tax=Croceibacterium xixiisoli TaxID=1476466 RepID=A0A6I4TPH7_9SPHN|nr:UrcA family protein [Croceibacterium xixiisoli]MXO97696.1 UrcA family protein [Croceibacterium xixiisoli]